MTKDTYEVDFAGLLEYAKKKYEEYLELSKVYALPERQEKTVLYQPHSPNDPLTTKGIYGKRDSRSCLHGVNF